MKPASSNAKKATLMRLPMIIRPFLLLGPIASLLIVALSAPAFCQGKIRILGHATIEVVPDVVSVQVGITNRAPTPTAALDQNSAIARKIIDFSKKFGVADQDIRTDSINLAPAFRTVRDANGTTRQEPDGYSASNMVRIRLTDISRLGTFMRQALDQGATNISGVHFGLLNSEKVVDEARTKAVEDAVRQAKALAEAAKVKLGPIQEIVHPPRIQISAIDGAADMPARASGRMAVPVEAGTIKISAEVDMTWAIE
jgi:uncharacterized protein